MNKSKLRNHTLYIVLIALFAAMLTGGKYVLSTIPNIEIVTLVIVLISGVFGLCFALPVILIFVTVEILIYGFGYWVIAYYVYWPLLSIIFSIFLKKEKNPFFIALLGAFTTFLFGLITTFTDVIFTGGLHNGMFFRLFGVLYARGILFYITHIISNFIILLLLYKPLSTQLKKIVIRL